MGVPWRGDQWRWSLKVVPKGGFRGGCLIEGVHENWSPGWDPVHRGPLSPVWGPLEGLSWRGPWKVPLEVP